MKSKSMWKELERLQQQLTQITQLQATTNRKSLAISEQGHIHGLDLNSVQPLFDKLNAGITDVQAFCKEITAQDRTSGC